MKVLFLDRDGTIIREPHDFQIDALAKVSFLPYVISSLQRLQSAGYELVMVSNQDGLGTAAFPRERFELPHNWVMNTLAGEGITFRAVLIDHHYAHENHPNRKPGTGMVQPFLAAHPVNLAQSYVIGDRHTDAQLALNLGCHSLTIKDPLSTDGDARAPLSGPPPPTTHFHDWRVLTEYLLAR